MDRLFRKLEHPQVTNIDVQWPGGVVVDSYPHTVPDLYAGEPVTVKARAGTVVITPTGITQVNTSRTSPSIPASFNSETDFLHCVYVAVASPSKALKRCYQASSAFGHAIGFR